MTDSPNSDSEGVLWHPLIPFHPPSSFLIRTSIKKNQKYLRVNFKIKGPINQLEITKFKELNERVIGLWKRTCFEFFILETSNQHYLEFNFSPPNQWNCFDFKHTNSSSGTLSELIITKEETPQIRMIDFTQSCYHFEINLKSSLLSKNEIHLNDQELLKMNIATILKRENFNHEYFALMHQQTKPNFHDFNSYLPLKDLIS